MDIKRDLLHRIIYSTDASAYREMPSGVFFPESKKDLSDIVMFAREKGISIIPRGAGTSLAGQVVGSGLVVDVSKYLNKILEINPEERWARVEPGVVLDDLNIAAGVHGLFFGPETSTSNRCCMAGMVGNNSCGSHSLVYGSTRDHLPEAEVILSDGSIIVCKDLTKKEFEEKLLGDTLEAKIYGFVADLLENKRALSEIEENFPDPVIRRRNTGYALDELVHSCRSDEHYINLCPLLAGSEGTLAFISEIKLNLVPIPPKERAVVCAHSASFEDIFKANLIALRHSPVAVEMMDSTILELSKSNISQNKNRFFIKGDPAAILIIEIANESKEELDNVVSAIESDLISSGLIYYCSRVYGADISRVWELRKSGLGLLTLMKGDAKPVSVTEDTAVAPARLPEYMKEFAAMLSKYDLSCVYHAHIGTGELHLRPILNLKDSGDVELFRTVARETALLVKKYRGSLSGEHGDGRLRGEFIPLMFGDYIYGIMKRVKEVFDPFNLFNNNKIVDTPPMNSSLRYQPGAVVPEFNTYFDFSAQGGWIRAIEQCNGSGDCRKASQFGDTMCPSFRATGDEKDVTRGRANILRELLTRPSTAKVFDQKEIMDALELCISCKACKSECPSNVDMARYKAEFLQHHYDLTSPTFRAFMVSRMADIQQIGSWFTPIYNFFAANRLTSKVIKGILKFSSNREIPSISRVTFRKWVYGDAHCVPGTNPNTSNSVGTQCASPYTRPVYVFADEFTNYNDAEVGMKFVKLLENLGYRVIVPAHSESGRAAFSKGMLKRARRLAIKNVHALKDIISEESPLVGIEPSCILSFRDEYPDLVGKELKDEALKLAKNCLLYDEFIMKEVAAGRIRSELFTDKYLNIKLHGHCHQKSLASVALSKDMLSLPVNYSVEVMPTGCCGMAGSFGYEKEHFDISMSIGEQTLFPIVRSAPADVAISAPGTSCRQQIKDGTGRVAKHPVELLYEALKKAPETAEAKSSA
ncbi:MAG: FAD-binding protein [Bacteroidetes bacterium GWF2_40_14]|nr:MAG: FAD-binding protein [Bacteroidetes bacterium GWF2_40_14]